MSAIGSVGRRQSSVSLTTINFPDAEKRVLELKCAVEVLDMLIEIKFDPLPDVNKMLAPNYSR